MILKNLIPPALRLQLRLAQRESQDLLSGLRFAQAAPHQQDSWEFPYQLELQQPIMPGALYDNKVHNFRMAIQKVEQVLIHPQEVFSFWKIIGAPHARNGFKKGRNIIGGQLSEEYGGGLCQVSSILYHSSLMAGLSIAERHHHSVDIYEEHERFTPLGADATVVFGYKDLRIKNNSSSQLRYRLHIEGTQLICRLQSTGKISQLPVQFIRDHAAPTETVITQRGEEQVARSVYRKK